MSQRLNQKLSRSKTSQETRRGGDKITKSTSAEQYKRKAERLQDQLTVVEAKLAAANAELSRMHESPQWRLVTIDYSDIQQARSSESDLDRHCRRCNKIFSKPSYLHTHPCWPGHPRDSFP
ncbi:hypothetical protein N7G274_009963 [Stereocaulon virgatum]|uniref:C2H2-type domain-containing protein n=1 Tax=Stereocaulon virgatum TaxID=373712 RepID=A0ABR3ZUL2_9LECA